VKAWLFASDECHIYLDGRTPAYIEARVGFGATLGKGSSHEFAFDRFRSRFSSLALLSQNVGPDDPLSWMREQREEVQYWASGFIDPRIPDRFSAWFEANPRQLIDFYLDTSDTSTEYTRLFDPKHAMIALPIRILADTVRTIRMQQSFHLSADHVKLFGQLCRIGGHPVARLKSLIQ
jgi:hypothetical protein